MRIVARSTLRKFEAAYPEAEGQLERWYRICSKNSFLGFASLKEQFNSVDAVGEYLIFNIKGNAYRLIVKVHYPSQTLWIKEFMTHAQYDHWTPEN